MTNADWYNFGIPITMGIIGVGAAWLQHYALKREDSAAKQEADRPK